MDQLDAINWALARIEEASALRPPRLTKCPDCNGTGEAGERTVGGDGYGNRCAALMDVPIVCDACGGTGIYDPNNRSVCADCGEVSTQRWHNRCAAWGHEDEWRCDRCQDRHESFDRVDRLLDCPACYDRAHEKTGPEG